MNRIVAVVGFVVLGLSPSFEDIKQSPEDLPKIVGYYAVAIALIWAGLWDGG
jgi:hypothetical protein